MKAFTEYLTESKKTYKFKIGVASELPEGFNENLKTHLDKFNVVSLSKGKKTPIQKAPLDFPTLNNCEVTYWELETLYPTTDAALSEYISQCCFVPRANIIVRDPDGPVDIDNEEMKNVPYETLLTQTDMGGESAQQSVGNNRVMDLMKELETARKESAMVDGFKLENSDDKQNNKSIIGD